MLNSTWAKVLWGIAAALLAAFCIAAVFTACSATCTVPERVGRHRDPATGIWTVTLRCKDRPDLSATCYDGGQVVQARRKRDGAILWTRLYCDGEPIANLPNTITLEGAP